MRNNIPKGFLKKYRNGKGEEVRYIKLSVGYLRLEYDTEQSQSLLSIVSFVACPSMFSNAIEEQLELNLSINSTFDEVTFISEMGVSGSQWSDGQVRWGHTYDDDDATIAEGKKIALDLWIDKCIEMMINPRKEILKKIKEGFNLKDNFELIIKGDDEAKENFWKNCHPMHKNDVKLVLEVLQQGINRKDGDVIFTCGNPLKRASTDQMLILKAVTSLLENNTVTNDFDRSELQEIIEAHALYANEELETRWLKLCEDSFKKNGLELLQVIHEGHLINSLAKVKAKNVSTIDFFKKIVKHAASIKEKNENHTSYISYLSILKALGIKKIVNNNI